MPDSDWLYKLQIYMYVGYVFTVLRPAQQLFNYVETSPLPVKGCKISVII
jgi:hypothetical protein